MRRSLALAALLVSGCGISEQVLRDEQARGRKYRDAYETQQQELKALKDKLKVLEGAGCARAAAP